MVMLTLWRTSESYATGVTYPWHITITNITQYFVEMPVHESTCRQKGPGPGRGVRDRAHERMWWSARRVTGRLSAVPNPV